MNGLTRINKEGYAERKKEAYIMCRNKKSKIMRK
jgi:hypothetical protein